MLLQIILWTMTSVAVYRLWENALWLSIVVIVLGLSYSVHPDEQREQDRTGNFLTATAVRLFWTFVLVAVIFVYSLFLK